MSARENILAKLRQAKALPMEEPDVAAYYAAAQTWDNEIERLKHWAKAMRAVKTEIFWVKPHNWAQQMLETARGKGLKNILLPLKTGHGREAAEVFQAAADIEIKAFAREIEHWKDEFFNKIDAGFTSARCAIAQTGTLLLWPDADEPRSQSLVPPVHFCLLDAGRMYDNFHDAAKGEGMDGKMPTNIVLVSGPSKTADIQLTLAYGAHGPRDLVVLAVLPEHIDPVDLEDEA